MVDPIPAGMEHAIPHITVHDGAAALEFYKKAFGAEEVMRMPGPDGKLMHAEFKIGVAWIFLAEEFPEFGVLSPKTLGGSSGSILIYVRDVDAFVDRAAKAGATVVMPPTDMFWGDRFSKLTDPFGHTWSFSTHIEDVPIDELARRSAEAFKQHQ